MKLNFEKGNGILPAVIQHYQSGEVLMVGMMNEVALAATKETGYVTFFSRTKNRLWKKGETSGNTLAVKSIETDCDSDSLLIKVETKGPVCHSGARACFANHEAVWGDEILKLVEVINIRKDNPTSESYVAKLFSDGCPAIARKVGEEALEVVVAALSESKERVVEEAADLLFHLLVLLKEKSVSLDEVLLCLKERR